MQLPILESMLGAKVLQQVIETWPEKYLHSHGAFDRLPSPFSDDILSSISAMTEAYDGPAFRFDHRGGGSDMFPIESSKIREVIDSGITVYLADVSSLLEEGETFVKALERELGVKTGSTRMTAFISAAGSGAPTHYDASEVISIQLVGSKKFFLSPLKQIRFPYGVQYYEGARPFRDLYPQITQGFPSWKGQKFDQIDMQPGSVLLMPRGTWHYSEAEQDSMAISVVLNPPTRVDKLLTQIKSTLLQDPAWRSPEYCFGQHDQVESRLFKNLPKTLSKLVKEEQNPNSATRSFQKNSRYLRNPGAQATFMFSGQTCKIEYLGWNEKAEYGQVVSKVPANVGEIIQWIMLKDEPFMVRDCLSQFPHATEADFKELLLRSEQSGFVKKLWFTDL